VMVLFFVNIRFRMPLAVLLMIPAAEFYHCTWLRLRDTWQRYIAADSTDAADPDCLPPLTTGRFALLFVLLVLPVYSWNHVRDTLPVNLSIKQQAWTDFQLGNAHLRLGEAEAAKACFLASLAADSTQQEVRLNLGLLAGSPAEAASWFQAELTLDPQSAKAWNNLGSLALDQGNLPEAIRCFDRALQLRPGLIDASWNLGLALCASGLKAAQAGRLDLAGMLLLKARDTSYDGDALQSLEARIAGGDE
jgi:tetratricopeptide (TPR) repeat protein